ncbi:MAG: Hsp20/alpha crystallin family protein [Pseudomonadales bacterium]
MNLAKRDIIFDFDKIFDGFYQPALRTTLQTKNTNTSFSPRVDIHEAADNYALVAELPGINKENLSVTVEDSTLTIEASNEQQSTEEGTTKALRKERHFGKFIRSFNLGQNIEQSDIKASFKDGLLNLTIPKVKEEVVKARQIDIH